MTVNSIVDSPVPTADAIMDELFGEVEQSLHIPAPQNDSEVKKAQDALELEDIDLTPEEDVVWIAPYAASPPPPTGNQSTKVATDKPDRNWITPVLLVCACGSALLASVLWSFHLAHRLSQLDRPALQTAVATTSPPQVDEPKYTSEIRELLSFKPASKTNPRSDVTTLPANPVSALPSADPSALPPPPLSTNPLPIPQTIYVPVYQPPTTALPPVETAPPATKETVSAPEASYTLVGVLSFGDRSSAMFEFAGTVQSVSLGKPVGNTGWILSKVQQRDVILKRNNETKSLVIGQKF